MSTITKIPDNVNFRPAYPSGCEVLVDGEPVGTVRYRCHWGWWHAPTDGDWGSLEWHSSQDAAILSLLNAIG